MICNNCGYNNADNSMFCENCGMKISDKQKKYCINCGAEMGLFDDFCPKCGTANGVRQPSDQGGYYNPTSEKRSDMTIPFIVFGTIIVALLIFFIIAFIYLNNKPATVDDGNGKIEVPSIDVSIYNDKEGKTTVDKNSSSNNNNNYNDTYYDEPTYNTPVYLFPSDTQYITDSYLDTLSKDDIFFIRNEIYARHGYIFKTEPFKTYFSNKYWYTPNPNFNENMFNSIEKTNKERIVNYEKRMGWR